MVHELRVGVDIVDHQSGLRAVRDDHGRADVLNVGGRDHVGGLLRGQRIADEVAVFRGNEPRLVLGEASVGLRFQAHGLDAGRSAAQAGKDVTEAAGDALEPASLRMRKLDAILNAFVPVRIRAHVIRRLEAPGLQTLGDLGVRIELR